MRKTLQLVSFTTNDGMSDEDWELIADDIAQFLNIFGKRSSVYRTCYQKRKRPPMENNSTKPGDGPAEGITTCKFDDAPIYKASDGWFHYPDFAGDHFHDPEPKAAEPASPVAAETIPTIEEMRGFIPNLTGGQTLHEFLDGDPVSIEASHRAPIVVSAEETLKLLKYFADRICSDERCTQSHGKEYDRTRELLSAHPSPLPVGDETCDCRKLCNCSASGKPHCHFCKLNMESA